MPPVMDRKSLWLCSTIGFSISVACRSRSGEMDDFLPSQTNRSSPFFDGVNHFPQILAYLASPHQTGLAIMGKLQI